MTQSLSLPLHPIFQGIVIGLTTAITLQVFRSIKRSYDRRQQKKALWHLIQTTMTAIHSNTPLKGIYIPHHHVNSNPNINAHYSTLYLQRALSFIVNHPNCLLTHEEAQQLLIPFELFSLIEGEYVIAPRHYDHLRDSLNEIHWLSLNLPTRLP